MQKLLLLILALILAVPAGAADEPSKSRYPRIAVIIDNYVNDAGQPGRPVAKKIERVFAENGFPVTADTELEKIDTRDIIPVFTVPPKRVAELARKGGVDAVVTGEATCNIVETSLPYGPGLFTYRALIEARVIRASDGRVIAMDKVLNLSRGETRAQAANEASAGAAEKLGKRLVKRIASRWREEIYSGRVIRVVCEKTDHKKIELLKRALAYMADTSVIYQRPLKENAVEIGVRFFGNSGQLSWLLSNMEAPLVDITDISPDKIELMFVEKQKDFTKGGLTNDAIR